MKSQLSGIFTKSLKIILIVFSIHAYADDTPNIKKENRLNRIYKIYNSEPTDEELWQLLSDQNDVHTYTIKKKDTLWDLSEVLFGDGEYWPKIWSLNREVLDPNNVSVGTTLSFIDGSRTEAPVLELGVFPGKIAGKMPPEVSPEVLSQTANVELPEKKEEGPLLQEYPPSIPSWSYKKPPTTDITMDMNRNWQKIKDPVQALGYFVSDSSVEGVGQITGTELGMEAATDFQYVYVHLDAEPTDKNYLVVKDMGEIKDVYSDKTARMIQVQGIVEIQNPVNKNKGIYRAQVKKSLFLIENNAKLIKSDMPTLSVAETGTTGTANARIFGGQYAISRHLFGLDSIVFLNQGSGSGIVEGQILPIFKSEAVRSEENFVKENPLQIGKLKVVRTTDKFSTAVIIEAKEELQIGDGTSAESVK